MNLKDRRWRILACMGLALSLVLMSQPAPARADFYAGKTITIVQGRNAGGTGDMMVRASIPFLQKYIPGNPAIVSEFMPGGGGRKAANYLFRAARPDGLTIGNIGAGLVTLAVLGESGVQYELSKFGYLGSPISEYHWVFYSRKESGFSTVDQLRAASGVRIGAQSVGHSVYTAGRLFAYLIGIKEPRFVTGYSGPEIDVALARGEIDARVNNAETVARRNPEWVEKRMVDFHSILEVPAGNKHARFAHLPEIGTFAQSPRDRAALDLQRAFRQVGSPYVLPPGIPEEQVAILREAFGKMFRDPEFQATFQKMTGQDATPLMPEEMENVIKELPDDPEAIALFKTIAGPDPLPRR